MSRVVGIEISQSLAKAIVSDRSSNVVARQTVNFDAANPAAVVAELRAAFGPVARIYLTLGMTYLDVKRVELPPMNPALKRRVVALEPDRFFARAPDELAVAACDDFIFVADARFLEALVAALEQWAPVAGVEPAPVSLARAGPDGAFIMDALPGETGLVEVKGHHLTVVRRAPSTTSLPAGRAASDYDCAIAATRAPLDGMLLSPALEKTILRRIRSAKLARATLLILAAVAIGFAIDVARARTLRNLHEQADRAARQAQPAAALRARIDAALRENKAVTQGIGAQVNVLTVMAALSAHLPNDAVVLNMHALGSDWQIEGTARDAAAIVPLLDQIPQFRDVRMVSPSSRFQEADRTYETFAVVFHAGSN